jgi:hypothetical protein
MTCDVVFLTRFTPQELLRNMALALDAVGDDRPVSSQDSAWHEQPGFSPFSLFLHMIYRFNSFSGYALKGFVSALTDPDIIDVFHRLGWSLWKIATTFAIGTPPEQLVMRSSFAAISRLRSRL